VFNYRGRGGASLKVIQLHTHCCTLNCFVLSHTMMLYKTPISLRTFGLSFSSVICLFSRFTFSPMCHTSLYMP